MTFKECYKAHYHKIVAYCIAYSRRDACYAEDIADEALIALMDKWDELNSHEEAVLLLWLIRAAQNKCLEFFRENSRSILSFDDPFVQATLYKQDLESASIPDELEEYRKYQSYLRQLEAQLAPNERKLFICRVEKQLEHRKIAKMFGISEAAVKMRWIRLRIKLLPFV